MAKGVFGVRGIAAAVLSMALSVVLLAGAGTNVALACGSPSSARTSSGTTLASTMPQVLYGQSGVNVLTLQLTLRQQNPQKYPLVGTGYYGDKTLTAVKTFQRAHGIRSSGIVGSKTWHALLGSISTTDGPAVPTFGIQPGECSERKVAELSNRIQRVYPYYTKSMPTSYRCYTSSWQTLVKDFQRRAGINADGIVGPKTWAALQKVVTATANWGC